MTQTPKYQKTDFKSPLEYNVYQYLMKLAEKYKFEIEYEAEEIEYTITKKYIPDFVLTFPDGRKSYIEAKGYLRGEDRTKLVSVLHCNPGIPLHIVFAKNNKLSRKARSRYSDWAERYNLPYALNRIPVEWLKPSG
jgi:hypothetical protein